MWKGGKGILTRRKLTVKQEGITQGPIVYTMVIGIQINRVTLILTTAYMPPHQYDHKKVTKN